MSYFKKIFKNYQNGRDKSNHVKLETEAAYIYQITEYGGQIWLTYNGCLFCPASLFKEQNGDVIDILNAIRGMYVERNTKHQK